MVEKIIRLFKQGFRIGEYNVFGVELKHRRFVEERNLRVYIEFNNERRKIFDMTVFLGRKPYYRPWIEIHNINNEIKLSGREETFHESEIEGTILEKIAELIGGDTSLFIEYTEDKETSKELFQGVPVYATRLGFKLFKLGFTWMKNWYYPEGGYEGGMKIQAEKPINDNQKKRNLRDIEKDIKSYLEQNKKVDKKVLARFKYISDTAKNKLEYF